MTDFKDLINLMNPTDLTDLMDLMDLTDFSGFCDFVISVNLVDSVNLVNCGSVMDFQGCRESSCVCCCLGLASGSGFKDEMLLTIQCVCNQLDYNELPTVT